MNDIPQLPEVQNSQNHVELQAKWKELGEQVQKLRAMGAQIKNPAVRMGFRVFLAATVGFLSVIAKQARKGKLP